PRPIQGDDRTRLIILSGQQMHSGSLSRTSQTVPEKGNGARVTFVERFSRDERALGMLLLQVGLGGESGVKNFEILVDLSAVCEINTC
ncbi:hypothetical protein AVEN_116540-1, partial [Araneus ventricosus]